MYCLNCGNQNTKVTNSRTSEDGKITKRRRECDVCNNRFTTFEKREVINLIVEKSGSIKERYNRTKLEDSILKATNKRKISISQVNYLINQLELKWINKKQISSKNIGDEIMKALLLLDEVAYIRYASVNLNFDSAKDFINFISNNLKIEG